MVVFLVLAGGGTVAYLRLRPATDTPVNAAASPTTPAPVATIAPTTTPPFSGDLRTLLLPKPTLAKAEKGNPSTNGNVSLEQAVEFFGGDTQTRTNLQALGFVRGASIGWFDTPKNYVLFISLYQFDIPAHTAEWLISTQRAWAESDELDSTAYFDGVQGGRWFIDKYAPAEWTSSTVTSPHQH